MSLSHKRYTRAQVGIPSVTDVNTSRTSEVNSKETTSQLRRRKQFSLKEKLEILKMYDQLPKMSQRSAANQLNISQPVLCKILKNRNLIENILLTNENSVRKRARGGKERDVESALKGWYLEVQKKNMPINGQILREKAKELAKQMGKEFTASDGWFSRWRKRENIVFNSLFRRKLKSACSQKESKVNISEEHKIDNDRGIGVDNKYNPDPSDCQIPATISEDNLLEREELKNWERKEENISQAFIKSESIYEEEIEIEEKPYVNPPTDEEMLDALRVLSEGVKHRTNNLDLHYEYEHFIYKLLKKVV